MTKLPKKKYMIIASFILIVASFVFLNSFSKNSVPQLTVLTYSSFAGVYGPGVVLQKKFEEQCHCKVQFLIAKDSTKLIQKLKLNIPIDVVVGFDQIHLKEFAKLKWKTLSNQNQTLSLPARLYKSKVFQPIYWSPIGWIYQNEFLKNIQSFSDFLNSKEMVSFPEPKNSTLGLQLYYWMYQQASSLDQLKTQLKQLKQKSYAPFHSWSLSYGFFRKGRVGMSLSWLTSLIYHQKIENDPTYHLAYFEQGHPYQVEFSAVPSNCSHCELAVKFVDFLTQKEQQQILMLKHYMFPIVNNFKPKEFLKLKIPKLISYKRLSQFLNQKEELLSLWDKILK